MRGFITLAFLLALLTLTIQASFSETMRAIYSNNLKSSPSEISELPELIVGEPITPEQS